MRLHLPLVERRAVAQYAYRMEGSSQGRGISALVAINGHEFLVLERNNRGLGVDAEQTPANKRVFRISLKGASDVSGIDLDAAGMVFTPVTKEPGPWLDLAAASTLAHASLGVLGGVSPEKWEGLTIGPRLADGSYLVLAGTDNDYSVTQDAGSSVQRDVYFKPTGGGAYARIRCDIGTLSNCVQVTASGAALPPARTALSTGCHEAPLSLLLSKPTDSVPTNNRPGLSCATASASGRLGSAPACIQLSPASSLTQIPPAKML